MMQEFSDSGSTRDLFTNTWVAACMGTVGVEELNGALIVPVEGN